MKTDNDIETRGEIFYGLIKIQYNNTGYKYLLLIIKNKISA